MAIKTFAKVPFGVNYLWDPSASVAIACATGAAFAREIFTGLFASDMGLWRAQPPPTRWRFAAPWPARPETALQHQCRIASSLDSRPIELRAKSAVFSSLADAILVSGPLNRPCGRRLRPQKGARGRPRHAALRQYRRGASTMFAKFLRSPTAAS